MISHLFHIVYVTKLPTAIMVTLLLVIVWSIFGAVLYRKLRIVCAIAVILYTAIVLYATIFMRTRTVTAYDFIPFSSFQKAVEQREIYRSMLMNTILFVPLGLTLPFVFKGSTAKRILLTVLIGFVFSVCIEAAQYIFSIGQAETDDVICNTVGTALGSCSYLLALLWRKLIRKTGKGKTDE